MASEQPTTAELIAELLNDACVAEADGRISWAVRQRLAADRLASVEALERRVKELSMVAKPLACSDCGYCPAVPIHCASCGASGSVRRGGYDDYIAKRAAQALKGGPNAN